MNPWNQISYESTNQDPSLMTMRKQLLANLCAVLALLGGSSAVANAEDAGKAGVNYLVEVVHTDGSTVRVPFEHNPVFSHTGSALKLTSVEFEMEYEEGVLDHFKVVTEDTTGIDRNAVAANTVKPLFTRDGVSFSGATPGDAVVAVALDGTVLARTHVDAEGNAAISLAGANAGVYVIKTGKTTFKIIKK